MGQALSYLFLQWKRVLKTLFKSVCVLLIVAAAVSVLLFGIMSVLKVKELSLVKVGIVISDDETTTKYVTDIIGSMESVKSICSFEYLDEDDALLKYNSGALQAVVVMPAGFYHDVQVGLNPPAVIYMPENAGLVSDIFKELLIAGVSYLQTAESGVYATLDVAREYGSNIEYNNIGNVIALKYLNEVFGRGSLFYDREVSVFSELSIVSYYMLSLYTLLLMFTGIIFYRMYIPNNKAVDNMLKIRGINFFVSGILKIIVMVPVIYILGVCMFEPLVWISSHFNVKEVKNTPELFGYLLIVSLTMSIYFQVIYSLTGDGKKGIFVLCVTNIISAVCSGLFIPAVYMAHWTQIIGKLLPAKYWMALLSYALTGSMGGVL